MSATTTCPTCDATLRTRGARFLWSLALALLVGVALGMVVGRMA